MLLKGNCSEDDKICGGEGRRWGQQEICHFGDVKQKDQTCWSGPLHGRVLVPCLQMNSTYHDSNIMINLPIWEVISCLLFKYFLRVKSLLYLLVLSQ